MLQGYIDDSGDDGASRHFSLAGYIAEAEVWAAFSADWEKELRRQPAIEYFKMSEAANPDHSGQFFGWAPEMCKCKLLDLLAVIKKYDLDGLSCSLDWESYNSIVKPIANLGTHPYMFLFWGILDSVVLYNKNLDISEKIDMYFDDQGKVGQFALESYGLVKAFAAPEVANLLGRTPVGVDDKQVLPVQAADMLVGNVRMERGGKTEFQWLYDELNATVYLHKRMTAETMQIIVANLNRPKRP
jgi:hypothetical protein